MKKFLAILVAAAMLAISASAIEPYLFTEEDGEVSVYADMTILKGTPVVDGVMDDIYLQSDSANAPAHRENTWGTGLLVDQSVDTTCWMLWDDNYLYIYGVTLDTTPGVLNDDPTAWCSDGVEFGFEAANGEFDGEYFFRLRAAGLVSAENKASGMEGIQYVANVTDDGHTYEVAIPLPNLGAGMVYQLGCFQAIDIYDSLALDICTKRAMPDDAWVEANKEAGDLDETPDYDEIFVTLSAEEVVVAGAETEPEKETETEAETVEEKVDTPAADAPQTFDAGIIAAVAAIVSAAGYAISKKR